MTDKKRFALDEEIYRNFAEDLYGVIESLLNLQLLCSLRRKHDCELINLISNQIDAHIDAIKDTRHLIFDALGDN